MYWHCNLPVADFFIASLSSLHSFDFDRNLFIFLVCVLFLFSELLVQFKLHVLNHIVFIISFVEGFSLINFQLSTKLTHNIYIDFDL